jgi:hypothetical protein
VSTGTLIEQLPPCSTTAYCSKINPIQSSLLARPLSIALLNLVYVPAQHLKGFPAEHLTGGVIEKRGVAFGIQSVQDKTISSRAAC